MNKKIERNVSLWAIIYQVLAINDDKRPNMRGNVQLRLDKIDRLFPTNPGIIRRRLVSHSDRRLVCVVVLVNGPVSRRAPLYSPFSKRRLAADRCLCRGNFFLNRRYFNTEKVT